MLGTIEKNSAVSDFRPSDELREYTAQVQKDYGIGHDILTKGWNELNGSSIIEDMNRGRMMMNAFVDDSVEDAASAWRWKGTRSMARNKGIAMHANLTAAYLIPTFQAQNEDQEIDRDFSEFMSDIVEWMCQDENSDYKPNFLSLVFAMESDPIVYLGAEYCEVMQTIKMKSEDGKFSKKEILDETLSGFKAPIYTADQILIANAFERNLQKQRFVMKRRWIDYDEAKAKYGEYENFDCVRPGSSVVYNSDDGLFYDIKDDVHENMVEEVTPMYRRSDSEVCFIGGIPMLDGALDNQRIKHRDNFDAPRYDIQQFGFYPIGSHFIFYKSMMNAMRWDNALYDASTEIVANRAMLDAEMPVAVSGSDKIDGEIIYPNAVVAFKDKDAKVSPLLPPSNLGNLMESLKMTEDSMADASVNETISGQLPPASQKAYTVSQAQANAKKIIGGVAKGLAASISRYGLLLSDIAVNHLTVPEVMELVGDTPKMKYKKFLLNEKEVGGKKVSKQLIFDESLIGAEMTDDEKRAKNLDLYSKSEKEGKAIYMANPELFAKMKYLSRADFRELFVQNDETMQALLTGLYSQLAQDPGVDHEQLLRELMYSYFRGRGEKFIAKQPQGLPPVQQQMMQGQQDQQKMGQGAQNARLSTVKQNGLMVR